ncbi:MMPL family transporter [Streptomyces sp. TP-A0356]|uniref:MMPL family transporter n=1 Tax=Streptomyces sp. TP-A0356 TaxID=1359208 RepID=UPI00352A0F28
MGMGMGMGMLIDAFVVRTFLLPALVSLVGRWNWWMPGALGKLLCLTGPPTGPAGRQGTPRRCHRHTASHAGGRASRTGRAGAAARFPAQDPQGRTFCGSGWAIQDKRMRFGVAPDDVGPWGPSRRSRAPVR